MFQQMVADKCVDGKSTLRGRTQTTDSRLPIDLEQLHQFILIETFLALHSLSFAEIMKSGVWMWVGRLGDV